MREKNHPIALLSLMAFALLLSIGVGERIALAAEKTPLTPQESNPISLRVIENKMYGHFENRPLSEVLDEIDGQLTFQYQVSQHLLEYRISGLFDGIPISDAMKKILKPFDYFLVTGSMGKPKKVFIYEMKTKSSENTDDNSSELPPATGPMLAESLKNPATTVDERFVFEVLDTNTSLPPEFQEYTSRQSSDDERMGPSIVAPTNQELPEFEPFYNATGPEILEIDPVEFLKFEPYHNEHGPIIPKL